MGSKEEMRNFNKIVWESWLESAFWSLPLKIEWVIIQNPTKNITLENLKTFFKNNEEVIFIYFIKENNVIFFGHIGVELNDLNNNFGGSNLNNNFLDNLYFLKNINWNMVNFDTNICIWEMGYQQIIGAFLDTFTGGSVDNLPRFWFPLRRTGLGVWNDPSYYNNYMEIWRKWLVENSEKDNSLEHFIIWYDKNNTK
jgi:hypothetical protein